MSAHVLEREQLVPRGIAEVFAFFALARNLEVLTPPWLRFEVLTPEPVRMRAGTLIDYRLRLHGLPLRWESLIEEWEPGRRFVDTQVRGPFRTWRHTHEFHLHPEGTLVRDHVRFEIPLGPLGELARTAFVQRDLGRIFDYRREAVARRLPAVRNAQAA
jgi:ligand-binding SRPBCC domain-containing protein